MIQPWFDGHLDLAMLAARGRDLSRDISTCGAPPQPASVTFPALAAGNLRAAFATIFICKRVRPDEARRLGTEPEEGGETFDTPDQARDAARRQVAIYQQWQRDGLIDILSDKTHTPTAAPLKVVLLMEGCAGLQSVEDFDFYYDAGVRIVSLTWAEGSIWSGGDKTGGDITPPGRELVARLDQLNIVHDVSHLSEQAFWTLMSIAKSRKIASHSNARALLPGRRPERHLSDDQIRTLVNAGGLIGINLYANFLKPDTPPEGTRASIDDVLKHIQYMEQLAGRRDFLALGSDMDGGFSRLKLPHDLDGPEHLPRLAESLAKAGWSDPEIHRFAWQNWTDLTTSMSIPAP